MSLWPFAERIYALSGVQAACLKLQDDHGQSVCLLLWRVWTIAEGRAIGPSVIQDAVATTRAWEGSIIAPLRGARRAVVGMEGGGKAPRSALYQRIAEAELLAEQRLLAALEALTPPARLPDPVGSAGALESLSDLWRPGTPRTATSPLRAALKAVLPQSAL